MKTNNMGIYKYFFFVIAMFVVAIFVYAYYSHSKNISTQMSDTPTNLPDISTPAGWQVDRMNTSQIIFTKDSSATFPSRIEVDALKMYGTLDQQIAHDYTSISGNATSSIYIGWSGMPMVYGGDSVSVGWATINGNLILAANDKATDAETTLDYSVFNNGIVYIFSTNYQQYDPTLKTFETKSPESIRVIQAMVQNFAESLPAGKAQ
jgi:hypothetical protein